MKLRTIILCLIIIALIPIAIGALSYILGGFNHSSRMIPLDNDMDAPAPNNMITNDNVSVVTAPATNLTSPNDSTSPAGLPTPPPIPTLIPK